MDVGERPEELKAFREALGSQAQPDSPLTQSLQNEFGVEDRVRVRDGRGGATKVILTHPSGAYAEVYTKGGNVVSWTLANGGEVFYVPEKANFKKHAPTDGGNPIVFPQFGAGGERPGSVQKANPKMTDDGFASKMDWRVVQTGTFRSEDGTLCPFLVLETADDEVTRSVFPHSFRLSMEISLEHSSLRIKTTVANVGASDFEYALGYKAHVAVNDTREGEVYYVGFDDCIILDNELHPTKPRVRFTNQLPLMDEQCFKLTEKTDRVYLNAHDMTTGVEVGTGCTVFVQNLSGEDGCVDRAVFSPWDESPQNYRWFAGLGIGNFGKLRVAQPDSKFSTEICYTVSDTAPSIDIRRNLATLDKLNALNGHNRPKFDLSDADLPTDLQ
jgi:glucose-6-phosphate 1-epimerase